MRRRLCFLGAIVLAGCELLGPGSGATNDVPVVDPYDDAGLSDAERATYRTIAAQLTVRYLDAHPDHPAADEVELPGDLWDAYYHFVLHLGESEAFAVTGVDYPGFHPAYSLESVVLRLDTTQAWARALYRGAIPTGNAAFDALAETYGFHRPPPVTRFWEWLAVATDTLYNVRALLPRLEAVAGVEQATVDGSAGDGNRLVIAPQGRSWRVDYYVGGGDCPAGCTVWARYTFTVSPTGRVLLVGRSDEGPPHAF